MNNSPGYIDTLLELLWNTQSARDKRERRIVFGLAVFLVVVSTPTVLAIAPGFLATWNRFLPLATALLVGGYWLQRVARVLRTIEDNPLLYGLRSVPFAWKLSALLIVPLPFGAMYYFVTKLVLPVVVILTAKSLSIQI